MPKKVLVYIPFDSGLDGEPALKTNVERYVNKYGEANCKIYYHGKPMKPKASFSINSPSTWLPEFSSTSPSTATDLSAANVDPKDGTIIVLGHGSPVSEKIGVKKANGGWETLTAVDVARRMSGTGLAMHHVYVKTLTCCGASLGVFNLAKKKIVATSKRGVPAPTSAQQIQDKTPCFACRLAMALKAENRLEIRVGGYPGYVDASQPAKLIQMFTQDVNERKDTGTRTAWNSAELPPMSAQERTDIGNLYRGLPNSKITNVPIRESQWFAHEGRGDLLKTCPHCMVEYPQEHDSGCPNATRAKSPSDKLVEAIWFNGEGHRLVSKRGGTWLERLELATKNAASGGEKGGVPSQ